MPKTLSLGLINRFFKTLSRNLDREALVLLTGAAAGNILGKARPSMDIDFAIRLKKNSDKDWPGLEEAIRKTAVATGISANYAQDIDRWGMISLMDYVDHTLPYYRFGKLRVEVLAPAYWSIGKMTRYLAPDVDDMVRVFKRQKSQPEALAQTWGWALKSSPKSAALYDFRRHAEDFFRQYGKKIWGRNFNSDATILRFYKSAGIKKT